MSESVFAALQAYHASMDDMPPGDAPVGIRISTCGKLAVTFAGDLPRRVRGFNEAIELIQQYLDGVAAAAAAREAARKRRQARRQLTSASL